MDSYLKEAPRGQEEAETVHAANTTSTVMAYRKVLQHDDHDAVPLPPAAAAGTAATPDGFSHAILDRPALASTADVKAAPETSLEDDVSKKSLGEEEDKAICVAATMEKEETIVLTREQKPTPTDHHLTVTTTTTKQQEKQQETTTEVVMAAIAAVTTAQLEDTEEEETEEEETEEEITEEEEAGTIEEEEEGEVQMLQEEEAKLQLYAAELAAGLIAPRAEQGAAAVGAVDDFVDTEEDGATSPLASHEAATTSAEEEVTEMTEDEEAGQHTNDVEYTEEEEDEHVGGTTEEETSEEEEDEEEDDEMEQEQFEEEIVIDDEGHAVEGMEPMEETVVVPVSIGAAAAAAAAGARATSWNMQEAPTTSQAPALVQAPLQPSSTVPVAYSATQASAATTTMQQPFAVLQQPAAHPVDASNATAAQQQQPARVQHYTAPGSPSTQPAMQQIHTSPVIQPAFAVQQPSQQPVVVTTTYATQQPMATPPPTQQQHVAAAPAASAYVPTAYSSIQPQQQATTTPPAPQHPVQQSYTVPSTGVLRPPVVPAAQPQLPAWVNAHPAAVRVHATPSGNVRYIPLTTQASSPQPPAMMPPRLTHQVSGSSIITRPPVAVAMAQQQERLRSDMSKQASCSPAYPKKAGAFPPSPLVAARGGVVPGSNSTYPVVMSSFVSHCGTQGQPPAVSGAIAQRGTSRPQQQEDIKSKHSRKRSARHLAKSKKCSCSC